jgi:benzoyl-CoA reductase/2-hydroxyglutaryl-CoA dehydratase subunit BcrC/BadD/HgdB
VRIGLKPYANVTEEESGDPLLAIAKRYLQIPCACMTPNTGRFEVLKQQVESLKPDLVIDIVLQSCHTYITSRRSRLSPMSNIRYFINGQSSGDTLLIYLQ